MDKDALIIEIGQLVASDRKVAAQPWEKYALVAWYGDAMLALNGFRYVDDGPGQPATPESPDLGDRIDALRKATRVEGKEPWRACVVRLDKASGKVTVEFAYEDADLWQVTPQTVAEVARRARP